jgi:hypothetical protein
MNRIFVFLDKRLLVSEIEKITIITITMIDAYAELLIPINNRPIMTMDIEIKAGNAPPK